MKNNTLTPVYVLAFLFFLFSPFSNHAMANCVFSGNVGYWGACHANDINVNIPLWGTTSVTNVTPGYTGYVNYSCTNSAANGGWVADSWACDAASPVNCAGSWSDNGTCSASQCGFTGVEEQTYSVYTAAANGGAACPYADGATRWGSTLCAPTCVAAPTSSASVSPNPVPYGGNPGFTLSTSNALYCYLLLDWTTYLVAGYTTSGTYYSYGDAAFTTPGSHTISSYCYNSIWAGQSNGWTSTVFTVNSSAVNGACSASHFNCNAGTTGATATYSDNWQWWCNGSGGGTNILCSEVIPYLGVTPGSATGITQTSVTFSGTAANSTSYPTSDEGFCYSTSGNPMTSGTCVSSGNVSNGSFSATAYGLTPGTTYLWNAYITATGLGTNFHSYNVQSFTTSPASVSCTTPSGSGFTLPAGSTCPSWTKYCTPGNDANPYQEWAYSNPLSGSSYWDHVSSEDWKCQWTPVACDTSCGASYAQSYTCGAASPGCAANLASATCTRTACAVNGSCSASHYSCAAGTSASNGGDSSNWTWACNGSGGGTNASCSESKSCTGTPWGTIANGDSRTAYNTQDPNLIITCAVSSQTRTCSNTVLSGSFSYTSCLDDCAAPGYPSGINSGASVTAYQSASVTYGNACAFETRTCSNGTLSGSYANASCTVAAPAPLPTSSASVSVNPVPYNGNPGFTLSTSNALYCYLLLDWTTYLVNGYTTSGTYYAGAFTTPGNHVISSYCYNSDWVGQSAGWSSTNFTVSPAPVACIGSWGNNGTCSVSACGQTGVVQQTYSITQAAANGGAACPYANGATQWGVSSCSTNACDACGTGSSATPLSIEPTSGSAACSVGTYSNSPADVVTNGSQAWRWSCGTATTCTAPKYGCTTTTDSNYNSTGPNNIYNCALTCANGGTNYPTCTPVAGTCGTANGRAYANGSSSYSPYAQCGNGTASVTSFPTAGNTTSWTCSGTNGGAASGTCSASQTATPINGVCSATHYSCSAGTSTSNAESSPNWTWTCSGSNGGTSASCSQSIPTPTNQSSSCVAAGTSATVSWSLPSGYTLSYFRISDNTSGTNPSVWIPENVSDTGPSTSFTTTPGHSYTAWIHTRLPSGAYSSEVYTSFSCASSCSLPWGGTTLSGTPVTAYQTSSVTSPATCVSQSRACTNGTLSGSYTNQNCIVQSIGTCGTANGVTYANGSSSYSPYAQCGNGTASVTSFPTAGNSTSWTCSGTNGGAASGTCSASQDVADYCGTGNGATPLSSEPSSGTAACGHGTYSNSPADVATNGSQAWRWSCGTATTCTAPKYGCTTTTDSNYNSTGPNNTYNCANTCANGGTNYPTCTPVAGTCGTANGRAYANGSSAYSPYTQCATGSSSNSSFPTSGNSASWTCSGTNGGAVSGTCSSSQTAAPVATLTASPNPVAYRTKATLNWSSTDATSCTAGGSWSNASSPLGPKSGLTDALTSDTTFTYQCFNGAVSSPLKTVIVTVGAAAGCTLPWSGTINNGESVTAYQTSSVTSPATCASESRTCDNGVLGGSYTNQACSVMPSVTLTSFPDPIVRNKNATLTWSSSGATSCVAAGGFDTGGATSGSVQVKPLTTSAYQITCTGPGGASATTIGQTTVTVINPTATITSSRSRVLSGASATITWSSSQVTSCAVSGPGLSSATQSGSRTVTISSQAIYTITCQTVDSPVSSSVTVNVAPSFQEF